MRVFIHTKDNPNTGPSLFLKRLAKGLGEVTDVEVTRDPSAPCDVGLHAVRIGRCAAKKHIVRLDGCCHSTYKAYVEENRQIALGLQQASGVVYQSEFCKTMCQAYLGRFQGPSATIFNGIDPSFYQSLEPVEKRAQHVFLTASQWRPHKRLRDAIECFLLAEIPDSHLYVAGDVSDAGLTQAEAMRYASLSNVEFLGNLDEVALGRHLRIADGFIHLCWIDYCPNCVVEAIGAGVPVICSNQGGTREIVEPSGGYVCEIDDHYDLEPVVLRCPPTFDRRIVADVLRRCVAETKPVRQDRIHIHETARRYARFFEDVVRGGECRLEEVATSNAPSDRGEGCDTEEAPAGDAFGYSPACCAPAGASDGQPAVPQYELLMERGDYYVSLGDWPPAMRCYKKAAAVKPGEPEVLVRLGVAALQRNQLDEAEAAFRSACRQDRCCARAYAGLAMVAQQRQDYQQAFDLYLKSLALDADNLTVLLGLFQTSCQTGSFAEVIHHLEVYLTIHPADTSVMFPLAALYLKGGRKEEARQMLSSLLALDPNHRDAANLLHNVKYSSAVVP